MRVVLLVAALFAVCAVVDVSARRIHKIKAALVAADAEEVDADMALPFDGDYWSSASKGAISAAITAESKKTQLDTAALLKQFFSTENIVLAQQQGASVVATIGTYTATAMTKQCNEGVCDDKWKDFELTGNFFAGGAGSVVLTCSVPQELSTAKCDINVVFSGNSLLSCQNIGATPKKCSNPKPTRYSSGAGSWMSNEIIINTAAPNSAVSDVYLTKDGLTINYKFFGLDYAKKLTFTAFAVQSANWAAYKPAAQPALPAPAPELVSASKAKPLTTSQILGKFFTSDNIQLAQMQGSTVPVRATIGAYTATAVTRTCATGTCEAPKPFEMTGNFFAGGEGSIVLTCSVPADLSQAKCDINFVFSGNTLMSCPNIGAAGAKCSNPRPTRYSSGAGSWMSNEFITTTVEAAEVYFTNDQLVVHFRARGLDYAKKLVFSDLTLLSTPLTEFGVPAKTNCLSKTTADAVLAAAAAKKGLKNAIALQSGPVAELIKSAPYKTVEDAVAKIKGIGPRNVVYVSFMWNFQC